jgi:hypothetical protein
MAKGLIHILEHSNGKQGITNRIWTIEEIVSLLE